MNNVYIVIKQGVYIQGVYGPFSNSMDASGYAELQADSDVDNYHEWTVHEFKTPETDDSMSEYGSWGFGPKINSFEHMGSNQNRRSPRK